MGVSRRSVLGDIAHCCRGGAGAPIHRESGSQDRRRLVDARLHSPGRRGVSQNGGGLRKGQWQYDQLQHHAVRGARAKNGVGATDQQHA